jgi:predicted nucleotidyltransferase
MELPPDFKELLEEFARSKVDAVIVGGYAVAFHGRPRTTKDIDVLLDGSADNLERAADSLERFGAPPVVVRGVRTMQENDIVYMGQPPLRIDFLRRVDGVATVTILSNASTLEVDGARVRVISLDDLIANKRAAGRPQDLIDAEFLERVRTSRSSG